VRNLLLVKRRLHQTTLLPMLRAVHDREVVLKQTSNDPVLRSAQERANRILEEVSVGQELPVQRRA